MVSYGVAGGGKVLCSRTVCAGHISYTASALSTGGGHHDCVWKVAGQHLKRSKSFTYLGMLFHEDSKIRHAVQARFSKACASVGSIFSQYSQLQCANSVQLLVRLQQAILQPCASYGCEAVHVSPLVFSSSTSGLPSLLGSPHEHCKVAEDFGISHGVSFAAN